MFDTSGHLQGVCSSSVHWLLEGPQQVQASWKASDIMKKLFHSGIYSGTVGFVHLCWKIFISPFYVFSCWEKYSGRVHLSFLHSSLFSFFLSSSLPPFLPSHLPLACFVICFVFFPCNIKSLWETKKKTQWKW